MACKRFSANPTASAVLTGVEVVPITNGSNVDQKTTPGAIAISATEYDGALTYTTGYQVLATDGNVYRALQNSVSQTPQTSPTYWKLILVTTATTLAVPSVHPTIISALTALNEAVLTANVTIQVANGSYNYTTTQINLTHPYGRFISIIGNTGTPASCSLSFSALPSPPTNPFLTDTAGSIYANGPSGVTINGFSVLKSGGAPVFGHNGIFAANSAEINVGAAMVVTGFYGCLGAFNGGILSVSDNPSLTTVANAYGIYADNGIVEAPGIAIAGPGDAIAVTRNGYVRIDGATIDVAIGIFAVMNSGTVEATSATIGNVDTFYEVAGNNNYVLDDAASYGTAGVYQIGLTGSLNYNGAIVTATSQTFARTLIETNTVQHVTNSTASVFLSPTGIDTNTQALQLKANSGSTGVSVATTGATSLPVSLTLGATSAHTGHQGGSGVLDAAGVLTVAAAWVTANTIIVPVFNDATATGPRLQSAITPATSFTLTSGAGAADVGKAVRWIAIVYP